MSKIKTTEDGWGCVPELKQAVRAINETNDMCYEINNCVRSSGLESLVNNMTAARRACYRYSRRHRLL